MFKAQVPEFNNYLAHIFSCLGKQVDADIRQVAGLLLKTNLTQALDKTLEPQHPSLLHIKQLALEALMDASPVIRNTAGNIVSLILIAQGVKSWPVAIQTLLNMLDAKNDVNSVDGAMSCIFKLCEDCKDLDKEEHGKPIQVIIPKIIPFLQYPAETVRRDALAAIFQYLQPFPAIIQSNMDSIMAGIFKLTGDPNKQVRKYVCNCFVQLVERPEYLRPQFNNIVEYMIVCTSDVQDENFALEACDFWNSIAESNFKDLHQALIPFLPKYVHDDF